MMIAKRYWKVYNIRSGDLSREVTYHRGSNRKFLSIRFNAKLNALITCNSWAGNDNVHFNVPKDTRGAYMHKLNDTVDCYGLNLIGYGHVYVPINAFSENHNGSNLDTVKELPAEIVDHISKDELMEFTSRPRDSLDVLVDLIQKEHDVFMVRKPTDSKYVICNRYGEMLMILRRESAVKFFSVVQNGDTILGKIIYDKNDFYEALDKTIKIYNDLGFDMFADALDNVLINFALA